MARKREIKSWKKNLHWQTS